MSCSGHSVKVLVLFFLFNCLEARLLQVGGCLSADVHAECLVVSVGPDARGCALIGIFSEAAV